MDHLSKPTLVMGAGGTIGRLVLDRLHADGVPVRASARRPERSGFPDGVDVHRADLTDAGSLEPVLAGVGQVFLFAVAHGVDALVERLERAGVERVVLLSSGSVIHATSIGNPIAEEHRAMEDAFASVDAFELVPIRPMVLATNALGWSRGIGAGRLALYRPDALTAPIDERDVAAVIVEALRGRSDVSGVLTGLEALTQAQQVELIDAAVGTRTDIEAISREDTAMTFQRFMPVDEAEGILRYLDDAALGNSPITDEVPRLLGRPAVPFSSWAHAHADAFQRDGVTERSGADR